MKDASQSKWLQKIKVYVERERKKNRREMIICDYLLFAGYFHGKKCREGAGKNDREFMDRPKDFKELLS